MIKNNEKIKVLFVCLGNICRSPLGEGVFRSIVNEQGLSEYFQIDSAGTEGNYNAGEHPDSTAKRVARAHGISVDNLIARQLLKDELASWDYIIAMDSSNIKNISRIGKVKGHLHLMREFDPEGMGDVPDPWGHTEDVFNKVYDMIERSCRELLRVIIQEYSLKVMEA